MSTPRNLTDEELKALGEEYRKLLVQAQVQLEEQRVFLRREIFTDPNITHAKRQQLQQDVDAFSVKTVTVSDENVLSIAQVQIIYEFPDDLYAYLSGPDVNLPKRLRGFLEGGIELKPADSAKDPMPQTGKTKARG